MDYFSPWDITIVGSDGNPVTEIVFTGSSSTSKLRISIPNNQMETLNQIINDSLSQGKHIGVDITQLPIKDDKYLFDHSTNIANAFILERKDELLDWELISAKEFRKRYALFGPVDRSCKGYCLFLCLPCFGSGSEICSLKPYYKNGSCTTTTSALTWPSVVLPLCKN